MRIILLDSGPLGLLSDPKATALPTAARAWLRDRLSAGFQIGIASIIAYEVRRELLRAGKARGLRLLDRLQTDHLTFPTSDDVLLRAAELWAQTRRSGRPTASDQALDCDVILAAQAQLLIEAGDDVVVATTNLAHFRRFVRAELWQDIH